MGICIKGKSAIIETNLTPCPIGLPKFGWLEKICDVLEIPVAMIVFHGTIGDPAAVHCVENNSVL